MSTTLGDWFPTDPEALRGLAEETALLESTELIERCLNERGISRSALAQLLGVSRSEVTQRLSGQRNLSVKSLGAMLHELGYRVRVDAEDVTTVRHGRPIHLAGVVRSGVRYTSTGNIISRAMPVSA